MLALILCAVLGAEISIDDLKDYQRTKIMNAWKEFDNGKLGADAVARKVQTRLKSRKEFEVSKETIFQVVKEEQEKEASEVKQGKRKKDGSERWKVKIVETPDKFEKCTYCMCMIDDTTNDGRTRVCFMYTLKDDGTTDGLINLSILLRSDPKGPIIADSKIPDGSPIICLADGEQAYKVNGRHTAYLDETRNNAPAETLEADIDVEIIAKSFADPAKPIDYTFALTEFHPTERINQEVYRFLMKNPDFKKSVGK